MLPIYSMLLYTLIAVRNITKVTVKQNKLAKHLIMTDYAHLIILLE